MQGLAIGCIAFFALGLQRFHASPREIPLYMHRTCGNSKPNQFPGVPNTQPAPSETCTNSGADCKTAEGKDGKCDAQMNCGGVNIFDVSTIFNF